MKSLQRGTLVSALGAPDHNPEVQLEMRGEIFDGMTSVCEALDSGTSKSIYVDALQAQRLAVQ